MLPFFSVYYSDLERVHPENGGTAERNLDGIGWGSFSMRGGGQIRYMGDNLTDLEKLFVFDKCMPESFCLWL